MRMGNLHNNTLSTVAVTNKMLKLQNAHCYIYYDAKWHSVNKNRRTSKQKKKSVIFMNEFSRDKSKFSSAADRMSRQKGGRLMEQMFL